MFKFRGSFMCSQFLKCLVFACTTMLTLSVGADRPQEWWKPARLTIQDGRQRVTQHSSHSLSREDQYDSPATERSARLLLVICVLKVTAMLASTWQSTLISVDLPSLQVHMSMHACSAASLTNCSTGLTFTSITSDAIQAI